ncbi:hypothetical protein TELCIR_18148, partial [Teladorsagia circumcincta]
SRKGFGRSSRPGGGSGGRFSGGRPYKTYIDFDAPPVAVRGPKIGGVSVGTGDIYLRRSDAENVIKDFKGVALDGQIKRADSRARMTEAELDAELEAYMSKPRAQ